MSTEIKDFNEFIQEAVKFESKVTSVNVNRDYLIHLLKAFVALGECLDYVKKSAFYMKPEKYDTLSGVQLDSAVHHITEAARAYQNQQPKDIVPITGSVPLTRLTHGMVGVVTEASEIALVLLQSIESGKLDAVNLVEELNDGDWYKAVIYDVLGVDPYKALGMLIDKLELRHAGKQFNPDTVMVRDTDAEREKFDVNDEGVNGNDSS